MPLPLTLSTSRGQIVSVVRTAIPSHPWILCWKLRNSHENNADDRDALILPSIYRLSRTPPTDRLDELHTFLHRLLIFSLKTLGLSME